MTRTAKLLIVRTDPKEINPAFPTPPSFTIGWDGINIASSAVGSVIDEAFCNDARSREDTICRFYEAIKKSEGVDSIFSGNGPGAYTDGKVMLFDHDFFPGTEALLSADEFPRIVQWFKTIEAMGFPDAEINYPSFEFNFISQGPQAEKEFLLATGHRWPNR